MGSKLVLPKLIPAVRQMERWDIVLAHPHLDTVFFLGGSIGTVGEPVARLQKAGRRVFIHVDMLRGLNPDADGMQFLAEFVGPDGIITTHSSTVQHARRAGLVTVQRLFLLDSQSLTHGVAQIQSSKPHAVEVLPGVIPRAVRTIARQVECPVIAGGLIVEDAQVREMLQSGAASVSTSREALWGTDWGEGAENG